MVTYAVQYAPSAATIAPAQAAAKLRSALERLPISLVLLGWNVPDVLASACADEAARARAALYRWHPLLSGDGVLVPRAEWQTIGLGGEPVPGFRGATDFTFVCPNQPAVHNAVASRLQELIARGIYHGFFLDRVRYPSPASDPERYLACFCESCRRKAAAEGLDLEGARQSILRLLRTASSRRDLARVLLGRQTGACVDPDLAALDAFLAFRARTVTRFVQNMAAIAHAANLDVGLDCFSPVLTRMVGQDLAALGSCSEWIKVMVYGHTLGPAGLPFELLDLSRWLSVAGMMTEAEALGWLAQTSGLPLPATCADLRERGISPEALAIEVRHARATCVGSLLVGIELMDAPEVVRLSTAQIIADLRAMRSVGADGLVLSWDLWHIPLERLDLVRSIWS